MREIANVAGGALKRAALIEGPVLSTGIPVDGRSLPGRRRAVRDAGRSGSTTDRHRRDRRERQRANRRIPAKRLIEGMIVVTDSPERRGRPAAARRARA